VRFVVLRPFTMTIGVCWDVTVWFDRCVTSQKTEVLKIQDIFFHIHFVERAYCKCFIFDAQI